MKLCFIINAIFLLVSLFCTAQENSNSKKTLFSLEDAVNLALQNNYDIQNQRLALESAKAQLRQVNGALDIEAGAQARQTMQQNPVDKDDPNYQLTSQLDIYSDNTQSYQTSGSVYLKKLFGNGLET